MTIEQLRGTDLYKSLIAAHPSEEGNLLENTDGSEEAQVSFILEVLAEVRPTVVLEVGTNKGLFGYLLSQTQKGPIRLFTCDIDMRSSNCVYLLNKAQDVVSADFFLGDSRDTLVRNAQRLRRHISNGKPLAWIDGGHAIEYCLRDIDNTISLGITDILIDDYHESPDVHEAVDLTVARHGFDIYHNPFEGDKRGIVFLTQN